MKEHTRPPRLAMVLLGWRGPTADTLIGDLTEEYRGRRSRLWFWRQTLRAGAAAIITDVRRHPVVILRGILVSVALAGVLLVGAHRLTLFISEGLFRQVLPLELYLRLHVLPLTGIVFAFVGFTVTGWIMATYHRRQRLTVTLATVGVWMMIYVTNAALRDVWEHTVSNWRFMSNLAVVEHLTLQIVDAVAPLVGMVLGGIVLRLPSEVSNPTMVLRSWRSTH